MSIAIMLLVVGFVAVITAGATAVRVVSRLWLRHWIEHSHGSAGTMARYFERPARLTHAADTGSMLMVFTMGALLAGSEGSTPWAFARDAALFLVLLLVVGQLIPRAIGRRWAPQLVPVLVPLLRVVDLVVSPFERVAQAASALVVPPSKRSALAESREGLEELLRDGAFDGMGSPEEMDIISGVMHFGDKSAADVMTARNDMFVIDASLAPMELARAIAQSAYSRVPIYRDTSDNIVGMIHVLDVFRLAGERMPVLRPVSMTTPDKPASELLFEFLRARRQLAIVRADNGEIRGLVTMEDLLEELVGDIRDEHDEPAARDVAPPDSAA